MKKITYILALSINFLLACNNKMDVDYIVINANVYTVDSSFNKAESFAVKDGKFVAVGNNLEVLKNYKSDSIINLEGRNVYPGFIDAHCHFYGYGLSLQKANLTGTKSYNKVIEIVKNHDQKYNHEWILGRGWDQNDWINQEFPDNKVLNELFPEKPVVLTRIDGHAAIANAEALKRAGIDINTKINGGKIIIKEGKLTGVLIDNAVDLVYNVIPKTSEKDNIDAFKYAQNDCFAVGLTTVSDAGLDKNIVLLIDSLQKSKQLKMRIYAMLSPTDENVEYFIKKGIYKTDKLSVRAIKLYSDGALGSRGAKLKKSYTDDENNSGILLSELAFLEKFCKLAYDNDYQVATHAIGDSANCLMLNIYAKYLKEKNDKRWRIEHAQVVDSVDFQMFAQYSIIPSVQPTHATSDMYWAEKRLGNERIKNAYAYKKLLNQNGWLPAGTDFPIESINPLLTFYAAVARKDVNNYPDEGFQIENALSREEALRAITIWAAKSNFEENEKGSIEAGKFADFVVTQDDIMKIDLIEITKVKVLETYIGGEKVF
ncbi:MAG: amidohydrolase [Bacteroidales bacterium]|nr:amidohydrolase [Bacteroidales bacterium]